MLTKNLIIYFKFIVWKENKFDMVFNLSNKYIYFHIISIEKQNKLKIWPILVFQFDTNSSHGKYHQIIFFREKIVLPGRHLSDFDCTSYTSNAIYNFNVSIINGIFTFQSQFNERVWRFFLFKCHTIDVHYMWPINHIQWSKYIRINREIR